MGAIATSSGDALAMTGVILHHANTRSTTTYAHIAMNQAKAAANRVGEQLATAMISKPQKMQEPRSAPRVKLSALPFRLIDCRTKQLCEKNSPSVDLYLEFAATAYQVSTYDGAARAKKRR